jgi:porphobilinogen synthase
MRRNRMQSFSRRLIAENCLSTNDLIWPLFVIEGDKKTEMIDAMPGAARYSIDRLIEQAQQAVDLGIPAIAIFPAIELNLKDPTGSLADDGDNLICRAVRAVKSACPELGIICDVALDPYTDHGHDGVVLDDQILNDETVEILCRQAVHQAKAGCDIIAPSDMMDGRIGAIRNALDDAGSKNVQILAYAAKYASSFYGPFRDAVKAGVRLGKSGKSTYQMDPANSEEAMHEIALDLAEGADMVMIKPGMPYLDILARAKAEFGVPCIAYQVSGEYSMQCAAFSNGWLDRDRTILETMMAFRRAGADAVVTYFAPDVAKLLHQQR